jgi:hypothetical protein
MCFEYDVVGQLAVLRQTGVLIFRQTGLLFRHAYSSFVRSAADQPDLLTNRQIDLLIRQV